jgi:hypothetical protein
MQTWDYDLPENWQPQTDAEWEWYLVRKINHEDLNGLDKKTIQKYFPAIKDRLDEGKRMLFEFYLEH